MMQELGCTIYLGTDNVMFVNPDIFAEMAFVSTLYKMEPAKILRAAIQGSELSGESFFIRTRAPANLIVIDPSESALQFSRDPVSSITKRVSCGQIVHNIFNS